MSAEPSEDTGAPTREIHRIQQSLLSARRQWARSIGTDIEAAAHREFHEAVMDCYTAMRPLLKNSNATETLWVDVDLWPIQRQTTAVAFCPACEFIGDLDKRDLGDMCPDCGNAVLERQQMPAVDEETGEPLFVYQEGLQTLEQYRGQREVRTVQYSDALGKHTKRVVEKSLLQPNHLEAAADALDEAIERLGLHAEVDDKHPDTDLDQETVDKFQNRVQEIFEEVGQNGDS